MARKNYYMILGVSDKASPSGIRAAYRDLAKKFHPDVAGEGSAGSFREVTEAYDVLSDPGRRRDYDHQLTRMAQLEGVPIRIGVPRPSGCTTVTIRSSPESVRPSIEEMCERFLRKFSGIGMPQSECLLDLNFEVRLTPEELAQGCVVPVCVPVAHSCRQCGGTGYTWVLPCPYCEQQGLIETERTVHIPIPPSTSSGTIFEVRFQGPAVGNFCVRLHVVRA